LNVKEKIISIRRVVIFGWIGKKMRQIGVLAEAGAAAPAWGEVMV
jgi:hypothetical protein